MDLDPMEPAAPRHPRGRYAGVAAAIVATAILSSATTVFASHQFNDVPDSNQFHDDIEWMADNGIADGFADGGYHPNAAVTRQAMAAFLHRLSGDEIPPIVNAAEFQGVSATQFRDEVAPMWAAVGSDASLTRGSNDVVDVNRIGAVGAGNYEVIFDREVDTCAFVATIGPAGSGTSIGDVNVALRNTDTSAVFVDTNNSAGTAADRPFHLVVTC
jgi:hypothetical protein